MEQYQVLELGIEVDKYNMDFEIDLELELSLS